MWSLARLSNPFRDRSAAKAQADAAHALDPGTRCTAQIIPSAWTDPDHLAELRRCQAIWDGAKPEQREAARRRLKALARFFDLGGTDLNTTDAYAAAGRAVGLSAGTVRKWHRRYRGYTPIERLVSLLDEAARRP